MDKFGQRRQIACDSWIIAAFLFQRRKDRPCEIVVIDIGRIERASSLITWHHNISLKFSRNRQLVGEMILAGPEERSKDACHHKRHQEPTQQQAPQQHLQQRPQPSTPKERNENGRKQCHTRGDPRKKQGKRQDIPCNVTVHPEIAVGDYSAKKHCRNGSQGHQCAIPCVKQKLLHHISSSIEFHTSSSSLPYPSRRKLFTTPFFVSALFQIRGGCAALWMALISKGASCRA